MFGRVIGLLLSCGFRACLCLIESASRMDISLIFKLCDANC